MEINCENYSDAQEQLAKALTNKEKEIKLNYIHWQTINEVLENLGFVEYYVDCNGWQYDHWSRFWIPGSDYYYDVECSWYYPETKFELETDIETIKFFKINDSRSI